MTNDRIGHYEPLIKNKCFQSIGNRPNIRKTIKQSWKQITNQDIKEILTAMTTNLIQIIIIIIKYTYGKEIGFLADVSCLQTERQLLVIQSIDQKHL